jgi:signal transduction histidine kinase
MMQRTARLDRYLKDLIIYSRISHELDNAQNINIKALVLSVFDLQSPPKDVSIVCEETLPEITTFIAPLGTVFSHLISNAIKNKNKGQLTINVSFQEYTSHYSFSVKDDGPGILEINHDYVFDLFKTIKPRDEVEGSGMGLSIIRKLLDSLNCVISVSSDGKNGSCFTFTWPKG